MSFINIIIIIENCFFIYIKILELNYCSIQTELLNK